ncbi:hypothetical protein CHL78_009745 [Romboutsia weinsteinii]|uniref:SdpI family protein n=1 Tax=Romboutsia weinsteinii TaxID=2020949 RepID=A0A371J399_9FIRM|nr:SdpI family protein [Romboutsia weinsteinii]RDY27262.1 hypothetical protein CHL78_009745 [Romboutsia weinsteinii]
MVIIFMGAIMFFMGVICKYGHDDYKHYPKLYVGYKVEYAMKDRETWEEANTYIYKPCMLAFIISVLSVIIPKVFKLVLPEIFYYIVLSVVLIGPILMTEIHLRRFNSRQ